MSNDIISSIIESVLLDPVNTGANMVGASASLNSVKLAEKQVKIAEVALETAIDNRDYQLEVRNLLHEILKELIHLNQHIDELTKN